ncbi:lipopolysaccharide heptosyltransferase I [Chitinivorax sp. PXF-14]|uniref:lipopolysaccharide heptosyltransferase I n=1 Tax=Chitinivorax sp. PXF-14 TaxID=3230488 RepID=UPI003467D305
MSSILIVKTSSMGDVIHALPAVTDLLAQLPGTAVDWVVEEGFAELPRLHPGVRHVLPVAIRRWRKAWWTTAVRAELRTFRRSLVEADYDWVIDLQGLVKSAWIVRQVPATRAGYDWASAREPLASLAYDRRFAIARQQHAVARNRQLAAAALGYTVSGLPDYGLSSTSALVTDWLPPQPYIVCLHATSRADKQWQPDGWAELARRCHEQGLACVLPWGSASEKTDAERLVQMMPNGIVAPRLSLTAAAGLLKGARATIGVDTGLSHLAAAVMCPVIALFTASDPILTGVLGNGFVCNLGGIGKVPTVDEVWCKLNGVLAG